MDLSLDRLFMNGIPSFKGRYCLAGKAFVRMDTHGNVRRCHGSKKNMGNLFEGTVKLSDKAEKCELDKCICPYLGYTYNIENPKFRGIGEYAKKV